MKIHFIRGNLFQLVLLFMLALLVIKFCMYMEALRQDRMSVKKYMYDYERLLCGFETPERRRVYNPVRNCPVRGIVTSFKQGDLSRHMWQYANVVAASAASGLRGYVPACLKDVLATVFTDLSLPPLTEIGHCSIPLTNSAMSLGAWKDEFQSIVIESTELWNPVVTRYLKDVCKQFVFSSGLRTGARAYLLRAKGGAVDATYIAVHVTNTKKIVEQQYDGMYPSVQFFLSAMNEFRKEFRDARFVVVTEDPLFWSSVFENPDVHVFEEKDLEGLGTTLSILAHCNHTILGSDGVAVWAAILSGGKTIVSLSLKENYQHVIYSYKNWVYLDNNVKTEHTKFHLSF